ncbi:MAG: hypothetical protein ACR2RE_22445 [Geminicoccaceae bacterium]
MIHGVAVFPGIEPNRTDNWCSGAFKQILYRRTKEIALGQIIHANEA